ncbi:DODA-type extradiol aromatic ring-opening family dioxygenase [Nocardia jiangsuensis]|uniref:Extradiol ring-cleavage dioxygenase class III enzyme subunit B domain-containing protein n=1 Tax=Nocardia jiangsuensis TaxID=1691563 RepID=A0ABV8DP95_9NOCA
MGHLVCAGATSHVGAIIKNPGAHPDRNTVLNTAWEQLTADLAAADPDVVIVVATDHYETFGLEHYPIFCLGSAPRFPAWGEFGNPGGEVAGAPESADALHAELVAAGFDVAKAMEMKLDHSFMVPILRLGLHRRAVVPFFVNCNTPPLPSLARCRDLGRALRAAITALPAETSVALIATGGVSHWVGLPEFGQINEAWDHEFLGRLERGEIDEVLALTDAEILEHAGNGALEIRTWLLAQACAGGTATVLGYAPMPDWAIGIGVVSLAVTA